MKLLASLDGRVFHDINVPTLHPETIQEIQEAVQASHTPPTTPPDSSSPLKGNEVAGNKEPPNPQDSFPPESGRDSDRIPNATEKDLFGEQVLQSEKKRKRNTTHPPYDIIYAIFRKAFPDWNFRSTTPRRNNKMRKLWNANGRLVWVFEELVEKAQASDFLNERNGHTFKGKLDLSWLIDHSEEILSDKYSNENMAWILNEEKLKPIKAYVVGKGEITIVPSDNYKLIGTDDKTGLPKYIDKN